MPEVVATERPVVKEIAKASNGLMLHLAHGEFDSSRTASLDKTPQGVDPKTYNALQQRHKAAQDTQRDDYYKHVKKQFKEDLGWPEEKITPEIMRHVHMKDWALAETIRVRATLAHAKAKDLAQFTAMVAALSKLHITVDTESPTLLNQEQFYIVDSNSSTSGHPGKFYEEFCSSGDINKKLIETLSEQDMVVLQPFLIDTLGSETAYTALLATKQTADAIGAKHDFSSNSSSLGAGEQPILDFLAKGTVSTTPTPEEAQATLPIPWTPEKVSKELPPIGTVISDFMINGKPYNIFVSGYGKERQILSGQENTVDTVLVHDLSLNAYRVFPKQDFEHAVQGSTAASAAPAEQFTLPSEKPWKDVEQQYPPLKAISHNLRGTPGTFTFSGYGYTVREGRNGTKTYEPVAFGDFRPTGPGVGTFTTIPVNELQATLLSSTEKKQGDLPPLRIDTGRSTQANPEHKDRNDDNSFLDPENLRGGIFDGAGGYANGDAASRAARDAVEEVMKRFPLKGEYPENPIRDQMLDALSLANQRVMALAKNGEQIGTTAAIFQIVRSAQDGSRKVLVANIGDSRVWIRHKDGTIEQVTRDGGHLRSMYKARLQQATTPEQRQKETDGYEAMAKQLDNARSDADLASNPLLKALWNRRNQTNLLGSNDFKDRVEFFDAPLQEGDTVFMTTDGVHDNLTFNEIQAIATVTANPNQLVRHLVDKAKEVAGTKTTRTPSFRAKPDDITGVAMRFDADALRANPEGTTTEQVRALSDKLLHSPAHGGVPRLVAEVQFSPAELMLLHTFIDQTQKKFNADPEIQHILAMIRAEQPRNQGMQTAAVFNDVLAEDNSVSQPRLEGSHIEVSSALFEKMHAYWDFQSVQNRLSAYESGPLDKNNPTYGQSAGMFGRDLETAAIYAAEHLQNP